MTSAKIYLGSPRQIVKILKIFRIFAFGLTNVSPRHIEKIGSVMLNLVIVNVGNSSRTRIDIVVLTLIAWVTLLHLSKGFPTTYNQDVALLAHVFLYNKFLH